MDKLNTKGAVRNRYAKVHPVVDRINVLKDLDIIASNIFHRRNDPRDNLVRSDDLSVDSYARQLQSDFGSLLLATNGEKTKKDTKVTKNEKHEALPHSEMPISCSMVINSAGKTKKHKHRNNRGKQTRSLFAGLRTELLNILKCILYVLLCWPVILFGKLILMIVNLPISALRISISKLSSLLRSEEVSCETEVARRPLKNKQAIPSSIDQEKKMIENKNENETLNFGDLFAKKIHGDATSVELSTDCVSEKYSNKLSSTKYSNKRKSTIRQYQSSAYAPENSFFKGSETMIDRNRLLDPKNCFLEKINDLNKLSKKCSIDLSDAMSVDFSMENKLRHVDSRILNYNNIYSSDKFNARSHPSKNSTTFLAVNSREKKRCEKSKVHTVSCPPLKPRTAISENKSTTVEENRKEKLEERAENFKSTCNESLIDRTKISYREKSVSQNSEPRSTIVEPINKYHQGVNKSQETFLKSVKNDSSKINNEKNVRNSFDSKQIQEPYNETKKPQIFCRQFDSVESSNESTSKNTFQLDIGMEINDEVCAAKVTGFSTKSFTNREEEKEKKITESVETENREHSNKLVTKFEETMKPSDLMLRSREPSRSIAEFTKPIDAKSKWLEMKKKFYGNDYKALKKSDDQELPDKLHPENLKQIKSTSKLPAQKMFQYNMLVGRARQMGAESLPSPDKNNPCSSSSALRQFILMQSGSHRHGEEPHQTTMIRNETGSNARKNSSQYPVKNFHRLSQTQSLSQWPVNPTIGSSGSKKFSGEEKPKPKPRNNQAGLFNHGCKIAGGAEIGCKIPQAVEITARINSSLSSSDVRTADRNKYPASHDRITNNRNCIIAAKTERFEQRAEEKLLQLSDGETDYLKSN